MDANVTPASPQTYYALIASQTLSLIGSNVTAFAVGIWLFERTGAATPLTLVGAFVWLSRIVAAGFGGALADRYDRRFVMIAADCGAAFGTVLLLASLASGAFELWHLFVVVVIQGACNSMQSPAFQATLTLLVPDARRDRANAIQQLSGPAAGVLAPPLAGAIYESSGVLGAIVLDLVTFAIATLVLVRLRIPRPGRAAQAHEGSLLRRAVDGFPYLAARPELLLFCVFIAIVNFLVSLATALLTPYGLARTGSAMSLGMVYGAVSAGAIAGGIVAAIRGGTRPRIHGIMWSAGGLAVGLALAGTARDAWTLGAALCLATFLQPFVAAPTSSILQAKVAVDVQGRVFAAVGQINVAPIPLSYLIAGPLADRVFEPLVATDAWRVVAPVVGATPGSGTGAIFVLCGLAAALITFGAYTMRRIRDIETTLPDQPPPATPVSAR